MAEHTAMRQSPGWRHAARRILSISAVAAVVATAWFATALGPAGQGASAGATAPAVAAQSPRLYPEPAANAVQDEDGHPPSF